MPKTIQAFVALAALTVACAGTARAEYILELEERSNGDVNEIRILVGDGRLAAVDDEGTVEMIFERASETIFMLDHDDRQYVRLDRQSIDSLMGEMDSAMAEMRRQLAAMPPEQRAMAERMMSGMMGGAAAAPQERPRRDMRRTSRRGEAAGIACNWYDMYEADVQVGTACVANAEAVPGGADMVAMINAMSTIYDELLTRMAESLPIAMPANPLLPMTEAGGLPIHSTEIHGDETIEVVLRSVRAEAVDPAIFSVPAGYSEVGFGN
jgi:hypothetical protein